MNALEADLADWHRRKFGPAVDVPATVRKLGEEVGELVEALLIGEPASIDEEAGDVALVLAHLVRASGGPAGGSLERAMRDKFGWLLEMEGVDRGRTR